MMRARHVGAILLLAVTVCPSTLHAGPVFEFSLTSAAIGFDISIPGVTVTGEIFGLPDNGSGTATDIVIDSISGATPADFTAFSHLPVDLMAAGCVDDEPLFPTGPFVVQNDVITSADFFCEIGNGVAGLLSLGLGSFWYEALTGGTLITSLPDVVGFAGDPRAAIGYLGTATYSLVSEVPEPSSPALMLGAGIAAIIVSLAIRRRRGRAAIENPRPASDPWRLHPPA